MSGVPQKGELVLVLLPGFNVSILFLESSDYCVECKRGMPEVFCSGCRGKCYHKSCFEQAKRHRLQGGALPRGHDSVPIELLKDLRYINIPNEREVISREEIKAAQINQFIKMDEAEQTLIFGPRARPLLRLPSKGQGAESSSTQQPKTDEATDEVPYPGFISFLGDTGTGKSWILRSLLRKYPHLPSPLSSPGKASNTVVSTSSNISLYADGLSASGPSPILFLDFEGLNGSDLPSTDTHHQPLSMSPEELAVSAEELKARKARRRHYVEVVYPRFAYTFSDCIVFLSTNTMQSRNHIASLITSFVNAAHGSRYQSFRPSLLIVYNKFASNESGWSDEASTAAFLNPENSSEAQVNVLLNFFETVRVVKIPSSRGTLTHVTITQLDVLEKLLREEHRLGRQRRVASRMRFSAQDLMRHLSRALSIFSNPNDEAPVFDWVVATRTISPVVSMSSSVHIPALASFWTYCRKHYSQGQDGASNITSFERAWDTFLPHVKSLVRLFVCRTPSNKSEHLKLADNLWVFQQDVLELDVPCVSHWEGVLCGGTRGNHQPNFHEGPGSQGNAWYGPYNPSFVNLSRLDKLIPSETQDDEVSILSVLDSLGKNFLQAFVPFGICAGCIFLPVMVTLSCDHSFCETCAKESQGSDHALYRLSTIRCPLCSGEMTFSPRFLPETAGYRMLCLGGGGVRGIAMIRILRALETQCFGIPIRYLFDFFIGAGVGGLLALTIASANSTSPLSLGGVELEDRFKALMRKLFGPSWDGDFETSIEDFFAGSDSDAIGLHPHIAFTQLLYRHGPIFSV
jgi:hypothetical protein